MSSSSNFESSLLCIKKVLASFGQFWIPSWGDKGQEPSLAKLKNLQLELWLEPARIGLIATNKVLKQLDVDLQAFLLLPHVISSLFAQPNVNGFTFSWTVAICSVNVNFLKNFFPHTGHLCGLYCSWTDKVCVLKPVLRENFASQIEHFFSFFPSWTVLQCNVNAFFVPNRTLQMRHSKVFLQIFFFPSSPH